MGQAHVGEGQDELAAPYDAREHDRLRSHRRVACCKPYAACCMSSALCFAYPIVHVAQASWELQVVRWTLHVCNAVRACCTSVPSSRVACSVLPMITVQRGNLRSERMSSAASIGIVRSRGSCIECVSRQIMRTIGRARYCAQRTTRTALPNVQQATDDTRPPKCRDKHSAVLHSIRPIYGCACTWRRKSLVEHCLEVPVIP